MGHTADCDAAGAYTRDLLKAHGHCGWRLRQGNAVVSRTDCLEQRRSRAAGSYVGSSKAALCTCKARSCEAG